MYHRDLYLDLYFTFFIRPTFPYYWPSLSACIEFKIVALVLKSKLGFQNIWVSKTSSGSHSFPFICNLTLTTSLFRSASSFVLRVRTTMAQTRSFVTIGPSLWNALPSSLCLTLLFGSLSAFLSHLKTYLYSWGFHTGSATERSRPWVALHKFRNTIWSHFNFDSLLLFSSHAFESHMKINHPYCLCHIVHAFICSRIDYCNSLLIRDRPKLNF